MCFIYNLSFLQETTVGMQLRMTPYCKNCLKAFLGDINGIFPNYEDFVDFSKKNIRNFRIF